jgi:hypothetical protein
MNLSLSSLGQRAISSPRDRLACICYAKLENRIQSKRETEALFPPFVAGPQNVLEKLLDQIDVCHEHAPAAVSLAT